MMSSGRTVVTLVVFLSLACASLPHSHVLTPPAPPDAIPSDGPSVAAWQSSGSAPCAICVSQRLLQQAQLEESPVLTAPEIRALEPAPEASALPYTVGRTTRPRAPPSA